MSSFWALDDNTHDTTETKETKQTKERKYPKETKQKPKQNKRTPQRPASECEHGTMDVGLDGNQYEARRQANNGRMRWYLIKKNASDKKQDFNYYQQKPYTQAQSTSNSNSNTMELEVIHVIHTNYNSKTTLT